MKEKLTEPYRAFCVAYDNHRCIEWMTGQEMYARVAKGEVNWILHNGQTIDGDELNLLRSYLDLKDQTQGSPSNEDLTFIMSQFRPEPLSRNEVSRLRNSLRKKLGLKGGW